MKVRVRHHKLAALAAAAIFFGSTPALAHDGPATRSGRAMAHHAAFSKGAFFRLIHSGDSGREASWHNGNFRDRGRAWGRNHDNGRGWGRGHNNGHGRGRGHGHGHGGHGHGGWGHGGGHPCSPG